MGLATVNSKRPAFTLVEMIVSIGLLAVIMGIVGTVFKVTTDSTGQAQAIMQTSAAVRLLEETLRRDLGAVNPGRSIMVIQANPINAYWNADHSELDDDADPSTGYPHKLDPERDTANLDPNNRPIPELPRADVLMFFTSGEARSTIYPDIWSNVSQVVYGHAELGDLDNAGAWVPAAPAEFFDYAAQGGPLPAFPKAAQTWHLARRSVLLVAAPESTLYTFDPSGTLAANSPDALPSSVDDRGDVGGDSVGPTRLPLVDGVLDIVDGDFNYEEKVVDEFDVLAGSPDLNAGWFERSRLDLLPPPSQASRLGHYFIPRCASFKVEWALDLRSLVRFAPPDNAPNELVWFDPANPAGAMDELTQLAIRKGYTTFNVTTDMGKIMTDLAVLPNGRFGITGKGLGITTPLWYANDVPNGGSSGVPDRYFPVALRVTVDIYDAHSRLVRPLRHVMILPVGTQ